MTLCARDWINFIDPKLLVLPKAFAMQCMAGLFACSHLQASLHATKQKASSYR